MKSSAFAAHRQRAFARLSFLSSLRAHVIPLAIVTLACCIMQTVTLMQYPLVVEYPDSRGWPGFPGYLELAQRILTTHQVFDAFRTPGYPLFLAAIFALTGGAHLTAVVFVQAALIIAAAFELYVLTYRMSGRRSAATIVAVLTGLNPFVTTFERTILTESLAYWLVVTLFLIFERYLRNGRSTTLYWCTLLLIAAILTRPAFLLLPIVLYGVVLIWAARGHTLRRRWKQVAVASVSIYALVLLYMGANALTTGLFGLSDVTNLDLFGKVMAYHMNDLPLTANTAQYAHLQSTLHQYYDNGGPTEPTNFLIDYPEFRANHLQVVGSFSRAEISQHPMQYLQRVIPDSLTAFVAPPVSYAPITHAPPHGFGALSRIHTLFRWLDVALPLLLLATAWLAWRRPERLGYTVAFLMLLAYTVTTLTGTLINYAEYYRMRFPLDWVVLLVSTVFLVELAHTLVPLWTRRHSVRAAAVADPSPGIRG